MSEIFEQFSILGVKVNPIKLDELLNFFVKIVHDQKKIVVSNVNIHALYLAYANDRLQNFFNSSEIVFCDGFGVKIAARFLGFDIPQRYTPPDWIGKLFKISADNRYKVFMLGSKPGIAEVAATISMKKYPGLDICGTHHGYFDKANNCAENKEVIENINQLAPDILLVGFGMPMQEFWIQENKEKLQVSLFLPVGALFDYLSGNIVRPPHWMTDHGLEWLGRLIIEPGRLWKRYLLEIPRFFILVLKESINKRKK